MEEKDPLARIEALINRLETMVAQRLRLMEENHSLRQQQDQLLQERALLVNRNEQAKVRIEAMLARLRALEEST